LNDVVYFAASSSMCWFAQFGAYFLIVLFRWILVKDPSS